MEKESNSEATIQHNKILREQNDLLRGQIDLLRGQNDLLRGQNDLLRGQNDLLRGQNSLSQQATVCRNENEREIYIDNIDRDEVRSGFLVTSHRKKLWNVQINLLQEFARICKKYNLRWFAIGGTLIGAARHGGFIPWDFDVDVIMLRPDYEKFRKIVAEEVKEPYFADNWYDYLLESEGASLANVKGNVQFITKKQEKTRSERWLTQWPSIRLRDNRTTMIEMPDRNLVNQGIWIDIFPMDPLPPFADKKNATNFEIAKVLLLATATPAKIRKAMQKKIDLLIDYGEMEKLLSKPYRTRGKIFDDFMNRNFFMSEHVGDLRDYCLTNNKKFYQSKDFQNVIQLPFEKIKVSAPAGYDSILTDFYGDWHKLLVAKPHVLFHSTDIPYKKYFQQVNSNKSAAIAEFF